MSKFDNQTTLALSQMIPPSQEQSLRDIFDSFLADLLDTEVEIAYSYHFDPGQLNALPENCYPPEESLEFEINHFALADSGCSRIAVLTADLIKTLVSETKNLHASKQIIENHKRMLEEL